MVDDLRWTVDTAVLQVAGRPPLALRTILLSLPPAGGSGVEVSGLDLRTVANVMVFDNGTVQTPTLRLTGTYDGERLTLTEPPVPAKSGQGLAERRVTGDEADLLPLGPAALETIRNKLRAEFGDRLLQSSSSGGILHLVLTAATPAQAEQLSTQYGPHLVISSWLRLA
jgi:hypothetical protein